jgi:DNA-binding NtrC family response regulator
MQVKLLRVLDGASYYRVGGTSKIDVRVRVVAATNQDLGERVRAGRFRADLYHRLSQIQLEVPALRERPADILPLAQYFLADSGTGVGLGKDAEAALLSYHWPGNVRELRNVLVKAAILAPAGTIERHDLPECIRNAEAGGLGALATALNGHPANGAEAAAVPTNGDVADWTLESMERRMIHQVLARTRGHQQKAADMLGISRRTLCRKLKAYSLEEAV